jgi:UDP-glucose 4-epimerase
VLPRPILRDWVYGPDVADALIALLTAPTLNHPVYNVTPGTGWTLLEWAQCFAKQRPGLVARLAKAGETPTVDPHSASDRGIMSAARLAADSGFKARYDLAASFAHLTGWIDAHKDAWEGR